MVDYEEKFKKNTEKLNKYIKTKSKNYNVNDFDDKVSKGYINTKKDVDNYIKNSKNPNPSLIKYNSKDSAIRDLHLNKGGDYDEVVDYVNNNWDKIRTPELKNKYKNLSKEIKYKTSKEKTSLFENMKPKKSKYKTTTKKTKYK